MVVELEDVVGDRLLYKCKAVYTYIGGVIMLGINNDTYDFVECKLIKIRR